MTTRRATILAPVIAAFVFTVGYETRTLDGMMVADSLPLMLAGPGGSVFVRTCPNDHVLTGFRYRRGLALDGAGIQCRPIRADGTLGSQINHGDMAGGNGGQSGTVSCPAGYVIASQVAPGPIAVVGCHEWIPATRKWTSTRAKTLAVYGTYVSGQVSCPIDTQPGRGIHGRHGMIVDKFGLVCGTP